MADAAGTIQVQVCYATAQRQWVLEVALPADSTLRQAILASGILEQAPEIDLASARVGIYSKLKTLEDGLQQGDRIEIYRPLIADPKEARRRRASRQR